ncbi:SDR family NAD(P)-dependent oxidoreductase [Nitratireductor arenosus]|nr:SDR family oxidoreductase [Nitratireductor arenosus]
MTVQAHRANLSPPQAIGRRNDLENVAIMPDNDTTRTPGTDRILVTGAASGIGRAVALRLLDRGWFVDGIDIAPADIALSHPRYQHLRADLATATGLDAPLSTIAGERYQGLVHAAGILRADDDPDTRGDLGARLWRLHVAAPQRLAETLLPRMPDRRGRIVLVSSRASQGRSGRGLYSASKAGTEGLARALALDCVARGITVNAVAPGPTDTPQLKDKARAAAPVALPPLGRLIAPDEIAATICFLLSQEAGAITGQTLYHCGGLSLAGLTAPAAPIGDRPHV